VSILYDDGFFGQLDSERVVSISGGLGDGKTLLAFTLAERYLRRGYRLASNVTNVWADDLDSIEMLPDGGRRCVLLLDEGGQYFRSMKSSGAVSAFARKLDMFVIIPSKREPHVELCDLLITLKKDLRRNYAIPAYLWDWVNQGGRKSTHGVMVEVDRKGYFGIYDTLDPGGKAEALVARVESWAKEFHDLYGKKYDLSDMAGSGGDNEGDESAAALVGVSREIRESLAVLEQGSKRRKSR